MQPQTLLETLVYLDRDFISGAYEVLQGHAPVTQVTKSEGMNAGAKIPFFSAGLSAAETRSFGVSTFGMLIQLHVELQKYDDLPNPPVGETSPSKIGWIEGEFSVFKVVIRSDSKLHEQNNKIRGLVQPYGLEKGAETYFAIRNKAGLKLALITTPDYFSSGISSLTRLFDTVLETVSIPVRALVRVFDAKGSFNEWIGVPLVIYEHPVDG